MNYKLIYLLPFILLLTNCEKKQNPNLTQSGLDPANFQIKIGEDSLDFVTLRNKNGMEVCLSNYGARILSIMVPDAKGRFQNVVLGFDSIQAYYPENDLTKLGGTIGRYTNRIGHGKFILDGDTVNVTVNSLGHSLHGGAEDGDKGWQYKIFRIKEINDSSVLMSTISSDGENGFPGTVTASVRYTVLPQNAIRIDYEATTDRPTVICMSNQSYFNLSGDPDLSISELKLQINADRFMPIDSTRLVTGEFFPVEGTPLDFRKEKTIGRDIDNAWFEQIKNGNGYDHTYVLNTQGNLQIPALSLRCKRSGIKMELFTTEPAIQFYTGNFLYSSLSKRQEQHYSQRHGLSLEPQHFPDSPNHPEWPSVILRPGEIYHSTSIYKFSIEK